MTFELLVMVGIVWTAIAGWIIASMCAAARADHETEDALASITTLDPLLATAGLLQERRRGVRRLGVRLDRSDRRAASSRR